MSVVRMGLSARAEGVSRTAAQRHWGGEHARLFARLPGLVSYIQNHAVLDSDERPLLGDPGFDIFSEVEYATGVELENAARSSYYRDVILPDEKRLLDASHRTFLMTRRRSGVGAPSPNSYKVVLFLSYGARVRSAGYGAGEEPPVCSLGANEAHCLLPYVVDSIGGTVPRAVDVVLQHYFASVDNALAWHERARRQWNGSSPHTYELQTAVVVKEREVIARPSLHE